MMDLVNLEESDKIENGNTDYISLFIPTIEDCKPKFLRESGLPRATLLHSQSQDATPTSVASLGVK